MRRRFHSDAATIGIDAQLGGSDAGAQIGNAVLLGVGVALAGLPAGIMPTWATAGANFAGGLLAVTAIADTVLDYGQPLIADTWARFNVAYSKRANDAPDVRLVPVIRYTSPTGNTNAPARDELQAMTRQRQGYQARDMAAFLAWGVQYGFARRKFLPDGSGLRFSFASRRAFSRGDYDAMMGMLRACGLLDTDGRLTVALGDALAAVMGNGRDDGQAGGLPMRADTDAGIAAGNDAAGGTK